MALFNHDPGLPFTFLPCPPSSASSLQPAVRDPQHRQVSESEVATLLSKCATKEVEQANAKKSKLVLIGHTVPG